MSTVRDILNNKHNKEVYTISPNITVFNALNIMAEKNVGALVVTEGKKVIGMFSERDYARKVILRGKSSKELTVAEIMTTNVLFVTPDNTVEECMALMTEKHVRHLPVLENDALVGLVSIGDVVKQIISDKNFRIKELERYISGDFSR
jgi:CBS domain-containing protein